MDYCDSLYSVYKRDDALCGLMDALEELHRYMYLLSLVFGSGFLKWGFYCCCAFHSCCISVGRMIAIKLNAIALY